jgi:dihydroflavonol-4-reductase
MSDRALVTGATGFVGGIVLARLRAEKRHVRALVRRPGDAAGIAAIGAETAIGDLADEDSLVRAAEGCTTVFHIAGLNQTCLRDPSPLYRVNVDGTERMLQAAARAGVKRVVYTSSAATLGSGGGHYLNESSPPPSAFTSHYARSKYEAERMALAFEGVEVVAVNPSSVQGPGRRGGSAAIFLAYLNGRLRFDLPARFGLCYTEDCVSGHLLAESGGRPGHRYILNSATLTNREAVDLLGEIAGLSDRPKTLPLPLAHAGAAISETLAYLRRRPTHFCRETVRTLAADHLYDGSRVEQELGLRYTPIRTALEMTVRWYVSQGLVGRPLPRLKN